MRIFKRTPDGIKKPYEKSVVLPIKDKNIYVQMLSDVIFWDVDKNKTDYIHHKQFLIERIAVYGNENDERIMNILYDNKTIIKCLKKSDSIIEKTINYYSFLFDEKMENFKCYSKIHAPMKC